VERSENQFSIRHDPVREKKGLKSWGVFENVSPDFAQGISQHSTLQEALSAKADLERSRSNDD
jgi:hypothetical protein